VADADRPIVAGQPRDLLPSERLDGSGVAAWVLRPDDLDALPVLTEVPSVAPLAREPIDARTLGRLADLPREPDELPQERRYRPSEGIWPEDGITLTYGELRRLIALHLAQLAATMPRHQPWLAAEAAAKAMGDGETPLRLREVLE
jgi:hypothetical protein